MTSPRSEGTGAQFPWAILVYCAALLALSYAPVLSRMAYDWYIDDDMGHGFFVPVVAGYFVWLKRDELHAAAGTFRPHWLGLVLMGWGALQLLVATLGVEFFLARTAFLISLSGVLMWLGGWSLARMLVFPLILLVFMVPIPSIIYTQITFPLQLLASRVAEFALPLVGIPVLREGNVLELPSQRLSVVEACSGIRSLLSLSFLSLVYGALFDPKPWIRWALLAATVPIAIFANALRVVLTGILSEWKPELAKGAFHSMEGVVMFGIALFLLMGTHYLINRAWSWAGKKA